MQNFVAESALAPAFTVNKLKSYLDQGYPIEVGRYTYGSPKLHWSNGDFSHRLVIGAFCSIADDVGIFIGTHGRHTVDYMSTYPMGMLFGRAADKKASRTEVGDLSVHIGNDVWIGRGAMIMAGVRVGDGAIIAARSVVNRDVPPYTVVGGVPAKAIKYRFDSEVIRKLIAIRWWTWPDELIGERLSAFSTPDFGKHLDRFILEDGL